ncbi:MAG: hypothetical protein AAF609_26500, partial [Cyanobacteria bacterium P01_C01_bin.120]
DSGFGVPCFEGGDRFLAQVETVGGGHRQESKLFIYFNRPDLYTDCYKRYTFRLFSKNLDHSHSLWLKGETYRPHGLRCANPSYKD